MDETANTCVLVIHNLSLTYENRKQLREYNDKSIITVLVDKIRLYSAKTLLGTLCEVGPNPNPNPSDLVSFCSKPYHHQELVVGALIEHYESDLYSQDVVERALSCARQFAPKAVSVLEAAVAAPIIKINVRYIRTQVMSDLEGMKSRGARRQAGNMIITVVIRLRW